jgi:hypothetical protein
MADYLAACGRSSIAAVPCGPGESYSDVILRLVEIEART